MEFYSPSRWVLALLGLLLAAGCTGPPAEPPPPPPAPVRPATTSPTPLEFVVQAHNATYNESYDFRCRSAHAVVNATGTEVTFYFYDHDRTCQNCDKPEDITDAFSGIKVEVKSARPLAPGDYRATGTWIMNKKKEDTKYGAAYMGEDGKVTLDKVASDGGARITGKIDITAGDSYVRCPAFTAMVCREKP